MYQRRAREYRIVQVTNDCDSHKMVIKMREKMKTHRDAGKFDALWIRDTAEFAQAPLPAHGPRPH